MSKKPKRKNLKPPGRCIFCGGGKLSHEHLWSEWMKPFFQKDPQAKNFRVRKVSDQKTPFAYEPAFVREQQGHVTTLSVRAVCQTCNNGWMSALENRAKPILTRLIKGETFHFEEAEQRIVATWCVLKIMVMEQMTRSDLGYVTPQEERTFLFNKLEPPPTWKIWIGRPEGPKWHAAYYHHDSALGEQPPPEEHLLAPNTQSATIGIAGLLVQSMATRTKLGFDLPDHVQMFLWRILPFAKPLTWPPSVIPDFAIDALAGALGRTLQTDPRFYNSPQGGSDGSLSRASRFAKGHSYNVKARNQACIPHF